MAAPSLGGESFGMVLTRAFACATPVVASDIEGYRDVMTAETGLSVPPGDYPVAARRIGYQTEERRGVQILIDVTREINFEATVSIARAAREAGVRRFVFSSNAT